VAVSDTQNHPCFLIKLDAKTDGFSGSYTTTVYIETAADPFDESPTAVVTPQKHILAAHTCNRVLGAGGLSR
jgi:hypothetical protein